jgi:hypothetical protein
MTVEDHMVVRRRDSPYSLENHLSDGGEVSLTRRPPFIPMKILGTHFY